MCIKLTPKNIYMATFLFTHNPLRWNRKTENGAIGSGENQGNSRPAR